MPKQKFEPKVTVIGTLDPWAIPEAKAIIASMRYNVDVKVRSITFPDGTVVTREEHEREKAQMRAGLQHEPNRQEELS